MKNYKLLVKPIMLGSLAICTLGIFSQVSRAQDCTTVTDDQLVTTILDEIKSDSLLAPQLSHIVVGSVNRFVKLQGWTDSAKSFDRLISIVKGVPCVAARNINNLSATPPPADSPQRPAPGGGCAAGLKACGDVCIPEGDSCSAKSKSGND